jgi:hypothetical protein
MRIVVRDYRLTDFMPILRYMPSSMKFQTGIQKWQRNFCAYRQ